MDGESSVFSDISSDEKEAEDVSINSSSIITGGTTTSLGLPNISPRFGTFSGVIDSVSVELAVVTAIVVIWVVDEIETGAVTVAGVVTILVSSVVMGVVIVEVDLTEDED